MDPIYVTNAGANKKLTAISYSPNSDVKNFKQAYILILIINIELASLLKCLVVGSSDGSIWVYAIKNLPQPTKVKINW